MLNKATSIFVIVVMSLAAACSPAAPTPTRAPEPTATPVEVRATRTEHLAGIWFVPPARAGESAQYFRWDSDGTVWRAESLQALEENPNFDSRFWFEDGAYHATDDPNCEGIGVYEVYLRIEAGRAVGLRMVVIEESDPSCLERRLGAEISFVRVDW